MSLDFIDTFFHDGERVRSGPTGVRNTCLMFKTDSPDAVTIRKAAARSALRTMFHDGLAKVILGETTLDELTRLTV